MKKFAHQDQATRKGAGTYYIKQKSGNILIALSTVVVLWSLRPKALEHLHGMALIRRYWPKFELVKKQRRRSSVVAVEIALIQTAMWLTQRPAL